MGLPVPLIAALWEAPFYQGRKRTITSLTSIDDLSDILFEDATSAIGVHPGPNFFQFPGFEPTVTLFEEPQFAGRSLTLRTGAYADLREVGFDKATSSVRFNLSFQASLGIREPATGDVVIIQAPPAATIAPIPLVIDCFTDSRPFPNQGDLGLGKKLTIVESTANIIADFGDEFNDTISGLRVFEGPNYSGKEVVRLWRDINFSGGFVEFGSGSYVDGGTLAAEGFDNVASSIQIVF